MMKKTEEWKEPSKIPKIAVDILIIEDNQIVLLTRAIEPFRGLFDLPGGMVEYGETVEQAAVREAEEETGLKVKLNEILGVYSSPNRDPRFHTIAIAFISQPIEGELKSSYEGEAKWYNIEKIKSEPMGFDHSKIINDYIKWKRAKQTYWTSKT